MHLCNGKNELKRKFLALFNKKMDICNFFSIVVVVFAVLFFFFFFLGGGGLGCVCIELI